jgi:hypothetical protein
MRIVIFLLTLFLFSCQTDEADEPEIQTNSATGIGLNRAILQATLEEVGPLKPVQYGFLLSTQAGVNVINATQLLVGQSSESPMDYSIELTDLQPNTEYFVRAFVSTASFTTIYYGEEISFRTAQAAEYITTLPATAITPTSVQLNGAIEDIHELDVVSYGFAWATMPFTNLLQANVLVVGETTSPVSYQAPLASLQSKTIYYYRSFLSNEEGTILVYGEQLSFTTN